MKLAARIRRFDRNHPWLRAPGSAVGQCIGASRAFAQQTPGARPLYLLGSRRRFAGRVDGYPAVDPHYVHCVVLLDQQIIDWSRRQLEPKAAHPYIEPVAMMRKEWLFWTFGLDILDGRL